MANTKEKRVRKLKKSNTWIWIIVFTILILLSCMLVGLFLAVYSSSFIYERFISERATVQNMSDVYEESIREGREPGPVLDAFGREYLILDEDGNVTVSEATDTRETAYDTGAAYKEENNPDPVVISTFVHDANIYPDAAAPFVKQTDGEVEISYAEIFRDLDAYLVPSERKMLSEGEIGNILWVDRLPFLRGHQEKMVKIPFWLGVTMNDQKSEFVAKSYLTFGMADLIFLIVIVSSIWLIVLTTYIVMLVNIITGIARRRKTLKVFFTDAVTQGYNYVYYVYRGGELIRKHRNRGVRYAVINLKFVGYRNFCVCHSADEGEKVMGRIYSSIRDMLNKRKEICAHAAEGDFALLLRDAEPDAVKERIRTIIEKVSRITDDHTFVFQAGIATIEPEQKTGERKKLDLGEIYNVACAARESLDQEDTGIAFFDEKLIEDRRWAETVQERQQAALDKEEFVVYYQPKYDPRTDELRGAEALIRWQSPELGFVPPGRMIPIFEKNGFITEIDHYMIKHVARDQKRWLDAGYRCVPVSVNVSRAHFIENDLAGQIRDLVDAEGTPHELVEIELTESAFFDDKKAMIHTIDELKSYGFAVSMDDFGSGYSSLNSLKDMPLDVLKLDAEFFRGENDNGRGEIIVSEAIKLAKYLDMRTVAEGVEVREQVEFLASQDCDMIQGYFYAKPMPAADYEVRMNERYRPKDGNETVSADG